jgi:exodeoxyribonuclease X
MFQDLTTHYYIDCFLKDAVTERFFPSVPIEQRAYGIHGISLKDLTGCRHARFIDIPEDAEYIIGHNISFDIRLLSQTNTAIKDKLSKIKLIDTLFLARALNKHQNLGFTSHSLDYLTEWYYPEHKERLLTEFHSAEIDILRTMLVLLKLIEPMKNIETWQELYGFQKTLKKGKKK